MGYLSCRAGSAVAVAVSSSSSSSKSLSTKPPPESPPEDRPKLRRFLHRDLEAATGGFSADNLLGRGSHGRVYKAAIGSSASSRLVAVKRPSKSREISREFHNEFEILSRIRSPRFVNLLGYSADDPKDPLLVVEFMLNGSLYDVIHSDSPSAPAISSWSKRIKIALQIAKAVHLLHSQDPPIVHRDIKSANVLMDKSLNAKLGDFGLAIRCNAEDQRVKSTPPAGTMGYLDPDYVTADRLSTKTDVFSFGILLLEIISGRKAIDVRYSPSFIVDWAIPMIKRGKIGGIYDPVIGPPVDVSVRNHLGLVAAKCVRTCREKRPGMEEVVGWLTGLTQSVRSRRWDELGIGNPCMMVETVGRPVE
ncbi:Serine/threonine-protein kinase-like protein [Raphanus sativus]|uniref:Serine/threonine-protein kinase-like protein At3g51990 n=1 Tax=Raphanus sativus TaxID=3726 RepID=A0A6J0JFS5_RAPSA|nr:serine/threonine-protein kinase-like protein At3g51990 [Raphanus sativus]KAJ4890126.1 Serine/threonine-protein kinase-like protein [Raphanus sativus]